MMTEASTQRFGAHMSVAGGLHVAFDHAEAAGCDCVAIFVKNQRQWRAPALSEEQVSLFQDAQRRTGIGPVVAHASYLINLASPDEANRRRGIDAVRDELTRCEALDIPGLVLHPGAHMGEGEPAGMMRIIESLNEIHAMLAGFRTRVWLENTAGQGTTLGRTIGQLGEIVSGVRAPERLGICLDTCHLFAAGYDLGRREAYEAMLDEVQRSFGTDRVRCLHMNDSTAELGRRLDRHEHILSGKIGAAGFRHVLTDARLTHAPRILETPKGLDERGRDLDRLNLARLRRLAGVRRDTHRDRAREKAARERIGNMPARR